MNDRLRETLHDRSRDVSGQPIGLEAVRAGARRIRLRRRVAGGAAGLVVLAVAVPTSLSLTSGGPDVVPDGANVAQGPTADRSSGLPPGGPVRLTTRNLPRGAAPQVAYLDGGRNLQLTTPHGTRALPVALQTITAYAGGWVGLRHDDAGAELVTLDADLRITDRVPSGEAIAVTPDGSRIAYVRVGEDGSQTLVNAPDDGTDPITTTFPARPSVTPIGFVDPSTVLYETQQANPIVALAGPDGGTALPGLIRAWSANPVTGLVAGQTSSSDTGSCWAVVDTRAGTEPLWRTCDYSLAGFSGNGRYVLASDPYLDGLGTRSQSVLDARTGQLVADYEQDASSRITLVQTRWEDDDTILSVVLDGNDWSMLRMDASGTLEQALPPVTADPYSGDFPFTLAASP